MDPSLPIVEARKLTRTYRIGRNEVRALREVDLAVQPGELVSIMGRSGSGKSTLLNLLGCLDRPTSGEVLLGGRPVGAMPKRDLPRVRRESVGFVFQQHNLVSGLSALENVMLPLRYARKPLAERRRRARELLELVGLADWAHHRPTELSGGQQQRVAIARALANDPLLVLADEPTGNLDTATAGDVLDLIERLNRERGQTFLLVTHDPMVAARTRRRIRMSDGVIVSDERLANGVAP